MALQPWRDTIKQLLTDGPFFIYDLDSLQAHIQVLQQSGLTLWYACKANPFAAILKLLQQENFRFDVASEGELQQLINLGIAGKDILMTGPAKSERFFAMGLAHRVGTFVIESERQLTLLQTLAATADYQPQVLLRLQLQWQEEQSSVLGGSEITPFGIDLPTAQQLVKKMTLPLLGFHVFQWGNILSAQRLADIWQRTLQLCRQITSDFTVLDVGGGLGIPYQQQSPLLWQEVVTQLDAMQQAQSIKLWLELGRYVVGPYGYYVANVVDRKTVYGKTMLVLDGGINHIARPALVGSSFPLTRLRPIDDSQQALQTFSVHGPLCTALDCLGEYQLPKDTDIGDALIFQQAGAYGFTESMPFFLCHAIAGEAVIEQQRIKMVRQPQPASSWLL
ncbi:MAG: PLP-dependent decarboxylase [Gammaproteobacteria bacterium]|nr:PLP-dependent decarboxylase [Gammaproteobacteria bacterium]